MKNLTTFNHVKTQFLLNEFVEKTVFQINKDLGGLSDKSIVFDSENSDKKLDKLIILLCPVLEDLLKKNDLQQFLYQVDLGEKKWMEFLHNQNINLLAEQVIVREAQKVFLRQLYSE